MADDAGRTGPKAGSLPPTLQEAVDSLFKHARFVSNDEERANGLLAELKAALARDRAENAQVAKDVEFLRESGLLFEINRVVLHQYGLALSVHVESPEVAGPDARFGRLQRTEDPDGMHWFGASDAVAKLERFEFSRKAQIENRQAKLGWVIQPRSDCAEE
jgi:hypothetical protein